MSDSATDEREGEWEFGLDDVTEGGQDHPTPPPIEPGDPSVEGAVFLVLGIALTLVVLFGV